MNQNHEQLQCAVKRGKELCAKLAKDYPELRLYPVFSRFGPGAGQCKLTPKPLDIVKGFPEMMVGPQARRLGQLLKVKKRASKLKAPMEPGELKEIKELKSYILNTRRSLYLGDTNIEFRLGILRYDILRKLHQDPRLPPGRNTIGSIRVIGGSLEVLGNE